MDDAFENGAETDPAGAGQLSDREGLVGVEMITCSLSGRMWECRAVDPGGSSQFRAEQLGLRNLKAADMIVDPDDVGMFDQVELHFEESVDCILDRSGDVTDMNCG